MVFNDRFVVYDQLSNTVKFLTKDFKFIQTIAGKGNGPGEVSGPKIILREFDQKLVIIDAVKNVINLYDSTGRFIKKINFTNDDFFIEDAIVTQDCLVLLSFTKLWFIKKDEIIRFVKIAEFDKQKILNLKLKKLFQTSTGELIVFRNDEYKVSIYNHKGELIDNIENKSFKNSAYLESEYLNQTHEAFLKENKIVSYPPIAENIFVFDNYLYVCLKPRAKDKFIPKIDVYNLKNRKYVKTLTGKQFEVLNNFCVSGEYIISIVEDNTSSETQNKIVKSKFILRQPA